MRLPCSDPDLEIGFSGTGLFTQTGGTTTVADALILGHEASGIGTLDLQGGDVDVSGIALVGSRGKGTLDVSGTGQLDVAAAMYLGDEAGSDGTVNISGGSITSAITFFTGNAGNGHLNVSGGQVSSTNASVNIANSASSTSDATVSGTGSLQSGLDTIVGFAGDGSLSVSDSGDVQVGLDFKLGSEATGVGQLNIGGGQISVGDDFLVGREGVGHVDHSGGTIDVTNNMRVALFGNATASTYVLSGGQLNVGDELDLAHFAGSNAQMTVSGGTLTTGTNAGAADPDLEIGFSGTGLFTQTGGTTNVADDVVLGNQTTGVGTLDLQGGALNVSDDAFISVRGTSNSLLKVSGTGQLDVTGTLIVGDELGSDGTVMMSGGTISAAALDVSQNGLAQFSQTGGQTTVSGPLQIGVFGTGNGTVTVNGAGASLLSSNVYVGGIETTAGGTGKLAIGNGDVDVANTLKIWSGGTVNLNGGTLTATTIDHTDGGTFNFTGGTLLAKTFRGDLIQIGGTFAPDNTPSATQIIGDYQLNNNGTLEIELDDFPLVDTVNISGAATLGGELKVTLLNGYEPENVAFTILRADTLSGVFATENLPQLRGGLSLEVVYDHVQALVGVRRTGIFGDVDLDGDVDFDDIDTLATNAGSLDPLYDLDGDGLASTFAASAAGVSSDSDFLIRTILGTEYGDANLDGKIDIIDLDLLGQDFNDANATIGGWLFGDFDGSGLTDITDLDLLGQNYGFVAATASAIAVPEPSTWCLFSMVATMLTLGRTRLKAHCISIVPEWHDSPSRESRHGVSCYNTLRSLGAAGVVLCMVIASNARADLVVTDPLDRATVTVTPTAIPAVGFITYTFSVEPFLASQEVTSIDASFSATTMRQVNPSAAVTVFTDFNGFFAGEGEDVSGIGDSQFHYASGDVLVGISSESPTSLSAAFTGFTPIQTTSTFGHVVLPVGDFGTFDFGIVVRDDGVLGAGETASFSSVSFGGMTAIPEASTVLIWSLLTVGAGVGGAYRRRRLRHTEMQLDTFENKELE